MKQMTQTTLNAAKKYGVTLESLKSWAAGMEYEIKRVDHIKKSAHRQSIDVAIVEVWEGAEATIEIMQGNCWECGEDCVSYGWAEGGVHTSTCSCKVQDFS